MEFWNKKTFCVVAGASRGIGQEVAAQFSRQVAPGSVLVLLARSSDALQGTKSKIVADPSSNCATVLTCSIDLSCPSQELFNGVIRSGFSESNSAPSDFEHSILVQCAASLGIERGLRVDQWQDVDYITKFYQFNLTSFILLNSVFCEATGAWKDTCPARQTTIVHISSDGAIEPFASWGLYCASRAAKDMLLRSIALESPHIQTLNYCPGSVDTDNYSEALKYTADPALQKLFEQEKAAGCILTPHQTVSKLVSVLQSKRFVKGEHVSYHQL